MDLATRNAAAPLLLTMVGPAPAVAQYADDRFGMWRGEWGWGHMMAGGFMMVLFWAAVIGLVVLLVRALSGSARGDAMPGGPSRATALDILEERYARGEISREEFSERREVLLSSRPAGRGGRR